MAGKVQPAVFELIFKRGQQADLGETSLGYVPEGVPFTIRCVTDESYSDQLLVRKSGKEHKKEYVDDGFEQADEGVYECEATSLDPASESDPIHVRRIRIGSKISLNLPVCSPAEQQKCGPNGGCALIKDVPTCFYPGVTGPSGCHPGFVGTHCDRNLLTDYVKLDTVQVAAGAGGACTTLFIVFIIVLGLLFFKEKRRTRQFLSTFGPLPERNAYGESIPEYPENPYKKFSADTLHEPRRMDSPRNAIRTPKGRPVGDRLNLPLVDASRLQDVPSVA